MKRSYFKGQQCVHVDLIKADTLKVPTKGNREIWCVCWSFVYNSEFLLPCINSINATLLYAIYFLQKFGKTSAFPLRMNPRKH